ncbi:MAG: outer membrane beta-barrel protein [Chitinophagaceae bacterium]
MKRNVAGLLVLLFLSLGVNAQTEKGSWLVGGNVGLNTATNDTRVTFSPSAGYFFMKNLAGGINVTLDYSKISNSKTTAWGVGPFGRYYLGTMNVRPFAHADVSFQSNKTENSSGSDTYNSTQYFLGAGVAAFINRNVSIEGLAGYKHTAIQDLNGTGGFNLRIGFQVYLGREQLQRARK